MYLFCTFIPIQFLFPNIIRRYAMKLFLYRFILVVLFSLALISSGFARDNNHNRPIHGSPADGSGLMLYLPLAGSTADSSGNGNNGSSIHPAYTANHAGEPNKAYFFNGVDNYITIPNSPSLNPTNQLTITMWLRVDTIRDNYMDFLVKGGQATKNYSNREYGLYTKRHVVPYYYIEWKSAGDSLGQNEVNSDACLPGQWVFITTIVDRVDSVMKFYVNGSFFRQVDDSYKNFNNDGHPLMIGWSEEGPGLSGHSPFKGAMEEVRLYNRVLSDSEIQALYSGQTLGVGKNREQIPDEFSLEQNFPNPFNPVTRIGFDVPVSGMVDLKIYNMLGQEIATLVNDVEQPGYHSVEWKAESVPSGVYFYRMRAAGFVMTKKLLLVR
jgi:hypothetical protein